MKLVDGSEMDPFPFGSIKKMRLPKPLPRSRARRCGLPSSWNDAASNDGAELMTEEILERMAREYADLSLLSKLKIVEAAEAGNKIAHRCMRIVFHYLSAVADKKPSLLLTSYVLRCDLCDERSRTEPRKRMRKRQLRSATTLPPIASPTNAARS